MSELWLRFFSRLRADEGTVYVEYVVVGALAVLVILASIQFFFGSLAALFQRMGEALMNLG